MLTDTKDMMFRAAMRIPPVRQSVMPKVSREGAAVMELGQERQWPFRVLGHAPVIEKPLFTGQWWIVPAHEDAAVIPAEVRPRVMERIRAVYGAGIRPKGWIIAHEVPELLSAPSASQQAAVMPWWKKLLAEFSFQPRLMILAMVGLALVMAVFGPMILGWLMQALLWIAGAIAAILAIPAMIFGLGAVAIADPVLILVTEDNLWIEIDRW